MGKQLVELFKADQPFHLFFFPFWSTFSLLVPKRVKGQLRQWHPDKSGNTPFNNMIFRMIRRHCDWYLAGKPGSDGWLDEYTMSDSGCLASLVCLLLREPFGAKGKPANFWGPPFWLLGKVDHMRRPHCLGCVVNQ